MTFTSDLEAAFNEQIAVEFSSAYTYLAMAAYFHGANLPGFGAWMEAQHEEELAHAMKLYRAVLDRGGAVRLGAIGEPQAEYDSPVDVFEHALAGEHRVTRSLHRLYETANEHRAYDTYPLLQWFVEEQVEEEATVGQILEQLRMVGDDGAGLLVLDRELAGRRTGQDE